MNAVVRQIAGITGEAFSQKSGDDITASVPECREAMRQLDEQLNALRVREILEQQDLSGLSVEACIEEFDQAAKATRHKPVTLMSDECLKAVDTGELDQALAARDLAL